MEVSKRNNVDKKSGIKLLLLTTILCVVSFSTCAQKRVYDIVADKDIKPKKLFKKGNYVKDVHLRQYAGVWISGRYTLKTNFVEKVEIDGVFKDEMNGVLIKVDKNGIEEFRLELKMNSSSLTFAYGRFNRLDRYDFFLHHNSPQELNMKIGENEVVRIRFQNETEIENVSKDIHLPSQLTFLKANE